MVAEIAAIYDRLELDAPDMPKAGPDELWPPDGTFLVGYRGRRGGRRRRRQAAPDRDGARSRGCTWSPRPAGAASRGACSMALEDAARELGYEPLRLDTGPKQPARPALYESAGYAVDRELQRATRSRRSAGRRRL